MKNSITQWKMGGGWRGGDRFRRTAKQQNADASSRGDQDRDPSNLPEA